MLYYRRQVERLIGAVGAAVEGATLGVGNTCWPPPPDLADILPNGALRLGVRPESWTLDAADGVPCTVRHIERIPTARAAYVHGTLAGVNVTVIAPQEYAPTGEMRVAPVWAEALFFDAAAEDVVHVPGAPELF